LVAGDDQSSPLILGEMPQHDHGHFLHFELACGQQSPVAGDDVVVGSDQDRVGPTPLLQGGRNLGDLLGGVGTRIGIPRNQPTDGPSFDL
jgi:hypothetical protein